MWKVRRAFFRIIEVAALTATVLSLVYLYGVVDELDAQVQEVAHAK